MTLNLKNQIEKIKTDNVKIDKFHELNVSIK